MLRPGWGSGVNEPRAVCPVEIRSAVRQCKPDAVFTTLGWRTVNRQMPSDWTISLGESTEKLAWLHQIGRDEQDVFAARSHRTAAAAWTAGIYDDWVIPVPGGTDLDRDESIRPESSPESLAKLNLRS